MKKKILILVGLCAFGGLCMRETKAFNPQQILINNSTKDNHIPSGAEAIVLRGKLDCNPGPDDIEAGATATDVYIYFNQNYGNVCISLYNPSRVIIYSTIVNTSTQQMVIIPITNISIGTYTLELSNTSGYAIGDFVHT